MFFILCIGSFNYYDYYFSKYMEVSLPYSQFLLKEMPAILDYALYTKSNVLAFRVCAGLKTFFFPCGTFSRIASVATNRQISK